MAGEHINGQALIVDLETATDVWTPIGCQKDTDFSQDLGSTTYGGKCLGGVKKTLVTEITNTINVNFELYPGDTAWDMLDAELYLDVTARTEFNLRTGIFRGMSETVGGYYRHGTGYMTAYSDNAPEAGVCEGSATFGVGAITKVVVI